MKKYIFVNSLKGGGAERVISSIVNYKPEKFAGKIHEHARENS